jgi:NAD(P)-dependent dehydrogenase (short-subunit alcohol dehydrogenase family)
VGDQVCAQPRSNCKARQMKQLSLKDKVALVTGGARGIGRAIAEAFAERGAQIIVADLDEQRAADLAVQIGRQSFSIRLDAGAIDTIEGAVLEAAERAGRIDILVNNAGIFDMAPLLDVTPQSFERLFQVNVEGMFFVLQAVARLMVRDGHGGCIINMASQAGRRGEAASAIYAATKAAVISLTQSAALALIKDRIRVNAIAPGVIDTEMWVRVDALYSHQFGLPLGEKKRQVGLAVPYGRMGHPCEVASAAVFLASGEAEYIVGQTLNVDGGNVLS